MTKLSKEKKKKKQPKKYKDLALYGRGKIGTKRWKIDYDYLNELSSKDKDFLNSFTEEYYLANFSKDKKTGKYKSKLLNTKKDRKKSWHENNVSNRDIMSLHNVKVRGKIVVSVAKNEQAGVNQLSDMYHLDEETENRIIEKLDTTKLLDEESLKSLKEYLKK